MVNKKYQNGRSREYRLMNRLKEEGCVVARTSGSHGIFDVIAIDKVKKTITFVQAKPKSMSKNAKKKLEEENKWLNDEFLCKFKVVSLYAELNEKQEVKKNGVPKS